MFALNPMIELLLHESCQVLYQISWTAEVCPPRVAAGSGACVTPFWVESSPGGLCSVPGFDCGMVSCIKEIVSVGTCATYAQTQMKCEKWHENAGGHSSDVDCQFPSLGVQEIFKFFGQVDWGQQRGKTTSSTIGLVGD